MANTYIKRTCDATAGGGYTSTWTWSAWVKRSSTGSYHGLFCNKKNDSNSNSRVRFYFSDADRLAMEVKDSTSGDDSFFQTNRLFRDVNAWFHIVLAYDTTQSAENDRIKLWINNEEVTSWEQFNRAGSGFGTLWSSAMEHRIGTQNSNAGTNYYFDGSMSHVHLTYGTAYTPSAFGETDATTGEWKIKTSPSVTYGSQGYFVLKDGNSLTDQSGEGNNFTVGGGTLTKTEDNPSNVFATLNPLDKHIGGTAPTFVNGNTRWTASGANNSNCGARATIGASSGKYYFEVKFVIALYTNVGMSLDNGTNPWNGDGDIGSVSSFYGVQSEGKKRVAGVGTSVFSALSNNDIGMFAYDLDNNKFWFGVNGSWVASGNPTTGDNPLGTLASGTYLPSISNGSWDTASSTAFNFGNGYFRGSAVSSAGTNASGNGIFEYDVPTGYTALSTKGLNL